jgi:DNA invertase Pin-like site-specific DNA recombinase
MYLEDGKRVPETLESLADKRAWLLERVEQYETEIVQFAKDAYLKGESARGIAKRAGVTHPTVLKWLNRANADGGNAPRRDEP